MKRINLIKKPCGISSKMPRNNNSDLPAVIMALVSLNTKTVPLLPEDHVKSTGNETNKSVWLAGEVRHYFGNKHLVLEFLMFPQGDISRKQQLSERHRSVCAVLNPVIDLTLFTTERCAHFTDLRAEDQRHYGIHDRFFQLLPKFCEILRLAQKLLAAIINLHCSYCSKNQLFGR
jgi:hypothetical protein